MSTPNPFPSGDRPDVPKDYLWLHLRELPYFRGLVRAVEARFYTQFELPPPVLDVGCGDGHFATVAFEHPIDVGLDPWGTPLREAARRKGYLSLVQSDGERMPFPDASFGSAFSNSVLEHIPAVEKVLSEISRVLKPGGRFLFCVPNHRFTSSLSIGMIFARIGMKPAAEAYRRFFNRIARHKHLDPPETWQARLEQAGFQLERWWHYYSPEAMRVSEWGHYFGMPSLICKKLTGRWILAPEKWNLALTQRLVRRYYDEPQQLEEGVMTFFVAYRKA